jgi:hypothetical protein
VLNRSAELPFDERRAMFARAWNVGHHEPVTEQLASLGLDQLPLLYREAHVDAVFDILSATDNRQLFLDAIDDDQLAVQTRSKAISELTDEVDNLPPDLKHALVQATKASDCELAGIAAITLARYHDTSQAPSWPHTFKSADMLRSLCLVATFERAENASSPSYLPGYIAPGGMTLTHEIYDPYVDPPDRRAVERVPASQAALPDVDQMIAALKHCTGTVCRSPTREFQLGFTRSSGGLLLSSIEVVDLPPCMAR